jgi:hypothetical protein
MNGGILATVPALLLPAPERERYERLSPLDVPFWSLLLGLAELFGSFAYLVGDYFRFMNAIVAGNVGLFGDKAIGGAGFDERLAYNWSGAFNVLQWYLQPHVLFFFLVAITGGARLVAWLATRESLGEPLVYVAMRIFQAFGRRQQATQLQMSLGSERPDRFLPGETGDRWLLSARARPDWQVGYSVDVEGEIFQIAAIELKVPPGEKGKVFFYHLREQPQGQLIRRLVAYQPR